MFDRFFKRRKADKKQNSIANMVRQILNNGSTGLHINLYAENQILFQIIPAFHYEKWGIKGSELSGFIELHFFSENKTLTVDNQPIANKLAKDGELIYFEDPKGIYNYIKAIGSDPDNIETVIQQRIKEMYSNIKSDEITIEYAEY